MSKLDKGMMIENMCKREKGLTKAAAGRILNGILDDIADATVNGEGVVFSNFGSWTTVPTQARTGRNPATGETITIPETNVPKFVPGSVFKSAVNCKKCCKAKK